MEFLAIFLIIGFFLLLMAISLITVVTTWRLFTKAGVAGWKSIIPIYNSYKMIEIAFGGTKNWLIIGPVLAFFFGVFTSFSGSEESVYTAIILLIVYTVDLYLAYNFARRYGDIGMAIAAVFVPFIIYPILAFGNGYKFSPYPETGSFSETTTNERRKTINTNRLYRSESDKKIAGVAGGLAEHFDIDPTLVRVGFAILAFFSGLGLLLYIVLALVAPNESELEGVEINKAENVEQTRETYDPFKDGEVTRVKVKDWKTNEEEENEG